MRSEFEREKIREEKKVAELAEMLKTYKIEIANCAYLAIQLREEEARLDAESQRLTDESDQALRDSILAGQEADKIERELNNQ